MAVLLTVRRREGRSSVTERTGHVRYATGGHTLSGKPGARGALGPPHRAPDVNSSRDRTAPSGSNRPGRAARSRSSAARRGRGVQGDVVDALAVGAVEHGGPA